MGPFLLGLDPWLFYESMKSELKDVLANHHAAARSLSADHSEAAGACLAGKIGSGRRKVELINGFAIPVLSATAQKLTGVTAPNEARGTCAVDAGPDRARANRDRSAPD